MQKMKWLIILCGFIFCLPLVLQFLPQGTPKTTEPQLVFASHEETTTEQVLVLFTHSHEAYAPIVQAQTGQSAYYDDAFNIKALEAPITTAFSQQQLAVHTMETDVMQTMQLSHSKFHEAYKVARPFIQQAISFKSYDMIFDIHRDSAKKNATTLKADDGAYAKIAIVIGLEHPMYAWNLAYAEALDAELNNIVPGISRGIMKKEGKGVDGVYNQDLAQQMLLIEIGGIENNEQELNRTIEVLAKAVKQLLTKDTAQITSI